MAEDYDIDNPPPLRQKWYIPILCFFITACNTVIIGFAAMADIKSSDWGDREKRQEIFDSFIKVRTLMAPGAALVMIWFGYRISAIIGSLLLALGLLIPTFLEGDKADVIGFLIAGLGGTGTAFLKLSALVPVIEYFQKGRIWCLLLLTFGEVVGLFVVLGTSVIEEIKIEKEDLYWKDLYRYLMIPVGVAFLLSFGLKPLDLNLEKCSLGRILGVRKWKIFKSLTLYAVILMAFLNSLGKEMPDVSTLVTDSENSFSTIETIVGVFTPLIGQVVAIIFIAIWSKCTDRKTTAMFIIMIVVNAVTGIFTIPAGHYIGEKFGLVATYGVIFGISIAVFDNLLDDNVPEIFGNQHVRLMEGLIGLSIGVGELVSEEIKEKISEDRKDKDDEVKVLHYVGGAIILSSIIGISIAVWRQRSRTTN